jgi:uncharacterized protein (TIGR02145 family)
MRNLALMWVLAGVAVALLAAGDGKPPVSTYTDKRDGKVYKIVKIGNQTWFAENLNYAVEESRCYFADAKNCAKYGRLYTWKAALTVCPDGTHLPTDNEWTTLVDYVGGEEKAGTKLKSPTGWNSWNIYEGIPIGKGIPIGTDEYGFSALPGGSAYWGYYFNDDVGDSGNWWSATEAEENTNYVFSSFMSYGNEDVNWDYNDKGFLFSVRCVVDNGKERRK